MNEETRAYLEYLKEFKVLTKPKMPNFDLSAYNDNEYRFVIESLFVDFDSIDDLYLTLEYLKGD